MQTAVLMPSVCMMDPCLMTGCYTGCVATKLSPSNQQKMRWLCSSPVTPLFLTKDSMLVTALLVRWQNTLLNVIFKTFPCIPSVVLAEDIWKQVYMPCVVLVVILPQYSWVCALMRSLEDWHKFLHKDLILFCIFLQIRLNQQPDVPLSSTFITQKQKLHLCHQAPFVHRHTWFE